MNAPGLFSAALAGLLSFLSPCVLPLIPAYLSFISGSSVSAISKGEGKAKLFLRSLAFSAGFTLAFTILGIVFSGSAMFVGGNQASKYVGIIGGILVIILGFNLLFDFLRFLSADSRLISKFSGGKAKGVPGSFLLGLAFAAGWSPCIGPILASILLMAGREGSVTKAIALLLSYSLGFAIPFLASGLFFDRLKPVLSFLTRKGKTVRIASGLVLVFFGLAMAAGSLNSFSSWLTRAGWGMEDFAIASPGLSALIGAALWILLAVAITLPTLMKKSYREKPWKKPALILTGATGLILAVAEFAGFFSLIRLLASWLTFAGI